MMRGGHRTSPHDARQRVPADWQPQSPGKTGSRAAAQDNSEMMNDALKPRCAPSSGGRDIFGQWFAEDLSRAHGVAASEPANLNAQVAQHDHATAGPASVAHIGYGCAWKPNRNQDKPRQPRSDAL